MRGVALTLVCLALVASCAPRATTPPEEHRPATPAAPAEEPAAADGPTSPDPSAGIASTSDRAPSQIVPPTSPPTPPDTPLDPKVPASTVAKTHKLPGLRLCYESALRAEPNLKGRLVVRFVIEADGNVREVTYAASDAGMPASFLACVQATIRRLRFPPAAGGRVTVVYPVLVDPGD